jgi:3-phosphoshikimate 1-carboxyvinyltransferase
VRIVGGHRFSGEIDVPGDKSESHRVVLISALADGTSRISGLSNGDDVARTLASVEDLGVRTTIDVSGVTVAGGLRLPAQEVSVDLGNSGTGLRLLVGAVVGRGPGIVSFRGDESLTARPMDRVTLPLSQMGGGFQGVGDRQGLPLVVTAPSDITGISYDVPVPSAQVKSAILFAGLGANSATTVRESVDTRRATEELMADAGIAIAETRDETGARVVTVEPGIPAARDWQVGRDPSQAAFFLVAAALSPSGRVRIENLVRDPARWGFLDVIERSGARVVRSSDHRIVDVSHGTVLPFTTDGAEIVGLDEVPILTVWAVMASGTSTFTNVGELRHKEVDRLAACADMARKFGAIATIDGDNLQIEGIGGPTNQQPTIKWRHDHRMVMASAIAGALGAGCELEHPEAVNSSFPSFYDVLDSLR